MIIGSFLQESKMLLHLHTIVLLRTKITSEIILQNKRYAFLKSNNDQNISNFPTILIFTQIREKAMIKRKYPLLSMLFLRQNKKRLLSKLVQNSLKPVAFAGWNNDKMLFLTRSKNNIVIG